MRSVLYEFPTLNIELPLFFVTGIRGRFVNESILVCALAVCPAVTCSVRACYEPLDSACALPLDDFSA